MSAILSQPQYVQFKSLHLGLLSSFLLCSTITMRNDLLEWPLCFGNTRTAVLLAGYITVCVAAGARPATVIWLCCLCICHCPLWYLVFIMHGLTPGPNSIFRRYNTSRGSPQCTAQIPAPFNGLFISSRRSHLNNAYLNSKKMFVAEMCGFKTQLQLQFQDVKIASICMKFM